MEGIGSRTGRPSSRYGSAPVFTGPVRRWQKQWVHLSSSSSSSSSVTYNKSSASNDNNNNDVSAIRIRRWTPVPPPTTDGGSPEERPRRKLRYAPIVVLEGKKKEAEKDDDDVKEVEESKINQSPAQETSENEDDAVAVKAQTSEKSAVTKDLNDHPMDLDTDSKDHDEDHDLGGTEKVADWVKAAQRGFAR